LNRDPGGRRIRKDWTHATLDDIIDFAIRIEEESFAFYSEAARSQEGAAPPEVVKLMKILALEERNHKDILLKRKATWKLGETPHAEVGQSVQRIVDLPVVPADAALGDVLLAAAAREKGTAMLYRSLMSLSDFGDLQEVFVELVAQEEGHERRLMSFYKSLHPSSTQE
jgi:rubrerythrin